MANPITSASVGVIVGEAAPPPIPFTFTVAVSVSPPGSGTTTGGGSFLQGTSATVTATANPGFNFLFWAVGSSPVSTSPSYTFTVNADTPLVATFIFTAVGFTSSAGVFDSNGALVRTLWSGVFNAPFVNNPPAAWDGTLDDGSVAPSGMYTVTRLTNNVTYTWDGTIGNTKPLPHTVAQPSLDAIMSQNYQSRGSQFTDFGITPAGELYFTSQYDERWHTFGVITLPNFNASNTITPEGFRDSCIGMHAVCTDGTIAYFGFGSVGSSVWGINCATKLGVNFAAGVPGDPLGFPVSGQTLIAVDNVANSFLVGIAVGSSNNILYVSRALGGSGQNVIQTYNKTTGAALQTFNITIVGAIAANPTNNELWAIQAVQVPLTPQWDPTTIGPEPNIVVTNSNRTFGNPTDFNHGDIFSGDSISCNACSAGKYYFEMHADAVAGIIHLVFGAAGFSGYTFGTPGIFGNSMGYYPDSELWFQDNQIFAQNMGPFNWTTGDNVGLAVDPPNGKVWFRKNGGNWNNDILANQNPATNTGGYSIPLGISKPVGGCKLAIGNQATANFKATDWVYAAPAGFAALNSTLKLAISKFTCDALGNLTDTGIQIGPSLVSNPLNLAVSPDGSTLLVVDAGTSQQVKAFNTSDGSVKAAFGVAGAFGDAGGYANGPAVSNTRFLFATHTGLSGIGDQGTIDFQADGSFWLSDLGNCRYLHFSSGNSPTLIEKMTYNPSFYAAGVCLNDDTRVFAGWLEYKIDYSQPFDSSWTLVNNWTFGSNPTPGTIDDQFNKLRFAGTFSNGRTYVILRQQFSQTIHEMTSTGYRDTGVFLNTQYIDRNFNAWTISAANPGGQVVYKRNLFTGFDGSNNPTWQDDPGSSPSRVIVTSQVLPPLFPLTGQNSNSPCNMVEPLANGVIPVYNFLSQTSGTQNHVGGIDSATGNVKFSTHPASPSNRGDPGTWLAYPESPYFDYANNRNAVSGDNGGGPIFYKPGATSFFTEYRGENWGSNQTNVWYHWHQSGLMIGRWGVAAPYFGQELYLDGSTTQVTPANIDAIGNGSLYLPVCARLSWLGMPGLAGNVFWGGVAFQNNKYYIYHNDEWYHGGLHRWTIDGLNTIATSSTPIVWNSGSFVPPTPGPPDLLATLPYNSFNIVDGTAGWHRNPTTNIGTTGIVDSQVPLFRLYTNAITANPHESPDLVFEGSVLSNTGVTTTYLAYRDLTRSGSGNWSLHANVTFINASDENSAPPGQNHLYLDIIDATGKKILRMQNANQGPGTTFYANGVPIRPAVPNSPPLNAWLRYILNVRPLNIDANVGAGTMQVTYGDYTMTANVLDVGADITTPTKFQISYVSDTHTGNIIYLGVCFTKLMFIG